MSEQLISLIVFTMVVTFSPGPNNVLMAASGIQVGLQRSVPLGVGILTGIMLIVAVAAIGLGSVVEREPALRMAMKVLGSLYLLWLGYKIAHAGAIDLSMADRGQRRAFGAGFANTMLNPKAWTMALSAAAGYSSLASSAWRLMVVIGLVFLITGIANWFLWCGSGKAIARRLRTERAWRTTNMVMGALVALSIIPMWLE